MKYYLYTDGSANNFSPYGEGGYAYIIANQNKQVISQFSEGELHATNNSMELKAIIKGCKAIKEDGSTVIVVSDSQYALKVLSGQWKAKANLDLIREHAENSQRLNIKYHWVKGHAGDELNEMADQLASDETFRIREQYGIPVFDYTNSPKVQSDLIHTFREKAKLPKKTKRTTSPKKYYVYIEVLLRNCCAYGVYSIYDEYKREYKTKAQLYSCKTEPRLRLMTMNEALAQIPSKAQVTITPADTYLMYGISRKKMDDDVCNGDVMKCIKKECKRLGAINFKNIEQSFQERRALEALCDFMGIKRY